MDDVILVSGVLVLRPSDEGEEEGIICEGLIEFRSPAGRNAGKDPRAEMSEILPSPDEDELTAGNAIAGEEEYIPDTGSME